MTKRLSKNELRMRAKGKQFVLLRRIQAKVGTRMRGLAKRVKNLGAAVEAMNERITALSVQKAEQARLEAPDHSELLGDDRVVEALTFLGENDIVGTGGHNDAGGDNNGKETL